MAIDVTSWMPNLLGPVDFLLNGLAQSVPKRLKLNFIGAGITVTDNPAEDRTDIDLSSLGGVDNGRIPVTFADANIDLTASPHNKTRDTIAGAILSLSGSNATGTRDLTIPRPADDTEAYVLTVEMGVTSNGVRLFHAGGSWTFPASSGNATHHVMVRNGAITALGPAGTPAQLGVQYVNASGYFTAVPIGAAGTFFKVNATANGYEWGASSGGSTPTGTGFRHVTSGVEDAAAKLVENADVAAAAAIAGTKIAPDFGAQTVTTTGAIQAGATPRAATGTVQLPNGATVRGRNSSNTADIVGLEFGTDNQIRFGNGGEPAGYVFQGGGNFGWYRSGNYGFYTDVSTFQFAVPRVGYSAPYASEGRADQAMADANQTAAASVYSRALIRCTGALAADRTLTLPHPASADASYRKTIENATTGGFSIVVSTGTGTNQSFTNNGKMHEVWITPDGVFLTD